MWHATCTSCDNAFHYDTYDLFDEIHWDLIFITAINNLNNTAFKTHIDLVNTKVLSFGLTNVSSVLYSVMNNMSINTFTCWTKLCLLHACFTTSLPHPGIKHAMSSQPHQNKLRDHYSLLAISFQGTIWSLILPNTTYYTYSWLSVFTAHTWYRKLCILLHMLHS
jgi:hypothetical protein